LSVCPGLYFRPHYFILLLPAVAILAGIGTVGVCETFARLGFVLIGKIEVIILAAIVLFFTLYQQWDYFFVTNPAQVSRDTYGANPFPESLEIAKFIKQNSREGDTIAVFGSEPQIYFYSGRRSATGYVYTYPLMERQPYALKMQEEMINQIEQANPKFLVLVHVYTSWLIAERSEKRVFYWFDKYASRSYQLIGVVDIISSEQTVYRWGPSASLYSPQSQNWLYVLRHNRYGDSNNVVFPGADATDSSK
jgi:hypothetical protein